MVVSIAIETPLQDDVRDLIGALNDHLAPLSPEDYQFGISVDAMSDDTIYVFVARLNGSAVGCGALKVHDAHLGEVKRMFTLPDVRGKKVGRAILRAIEQKAQDLSLQQLKLETGVGDKFAAAHRLYDRGGFVACEAFLDYPDSGFSAFFEKAL